MINSRTVGENWLAVRSNAMNRGIVQWLRFKAIMGHEPPL
jgi:hypothetical protein